MAFYGDGLTRDTNYFRTARTLVNALKWCSVLILVLGLLVFILSIILFGLEFSKLFTAIRGIRIIPGFLLAFIAIGAGVIGCTVGWFEGRIHNTSAKNVALALAVILLFCCLFYLFIVATVYFYDLYLEKARTVATWTSHNYAIFGIFVVIWVIALFLLILAIVVIIICVTWTSKANEALSDNDKVMDSPYDWSRSPYTRY